MNFYGDTILYSDTIFVAKRHCLVNILLRSSEIKFWGHMLNKYPLVVSIQNLVENQPN